MRLQTEGTFIQGGMPCGNLVRSQTIATQIYHHVSLWYGTKTNARMLSPESSILDGATTTQLFVHTRSRSFPGGFEVRTYSLGCKRIHDTALGTAVNIGTRRPCPATHEPTVQVANLSTSHVPWAESTDCRRSVLPSVRLTTLGKSPENQPSVCIFTLLLEGFLFLGRISY